jgi:hypothetical protein
MSPIASVSSRSASAMSSARLTAFSASSGVTLARTTASMRTTISVRILDQCGGTVEPLGGSEPSRERLIAEKRERRHRDEADSQGDDSAVRRRAILRGETGSGPAVADGSDTRGAEGSRPLCSGLGAPLSEFTSSVMDAQSTGRSSLPLYRTRPARAKSERYSNAARWPENRPNTDKIAFILRESACLLLADL